MRSTFYTRLPLRAIVERFVSYDAAAVERAMADGGWVDKFAVFHTFHVRLECGHEEYDRGQAKKARCSQCGVLFGVYSESHTEAQ